MRKLLTFLFILCLAQLHAQLVIDPGKDTTICTSWKGFDNFVFGTSPTATGGTAPYTYTWECNYTYTIGSHSTDLTASFFLSDTTVANPSLIESIIEPLTFYLTVTDNNGVSVQDSIHLNVSHFGTHLMEYTYYILAGDSVYYNHIPNLGGGIEPVEYLWQPNHGLEDSTSYTGFWLKPTETTSYFITATDSAGCQVSSTPVIDVYVNSVGLEDIEGGNLLSLYPNPVKNTLKIEIEGIYDLKIVNVLGEEMLFQTINSNNETVDVSVLPPGNYTLLLTNDEHRITRKLVIIE